MLSLIHISIVACLFGVMNVLKVGFIQSLPLAEVGLSWVIPVLIVSVISIVVTSSKSNKMCIRDRANGYILACCTTIIGDIEVLTNSSLDLSLIHI